MSILVTGATGFVGLHIARRLAATGQKVLALDCDVPDVVASNVFAAAGDNIRFVRGNVRDRVALRDLVENGGIRRIVHAAAVTPTADDERVNPTTVIDVNLNGTLNMLEAARLCAVERFVFISSTAVYGSPEGRVLPIQEDQPLTINGIYTIAKQTSEHLCSRYADLYGMSTVVGRLGTAYGPLERPTGARTRMSQVHALVHAALEGRTLTIAGADLPRDVCYVDDVAEAFVRLTLAEQLRWPVYNVSAGEAHSLRAIATAIATHVPGFTWHETDDAAHADLVVMPASARGPLDLTRLRTDTDFSPVHPLSQGLRSYFDWLHASH
ncbi:MAG: hypothetical protein AVDCRST_MAG93-28 [uncultured Chloroflexia bacterium]|uniref:Ketoreductase domain-containing protein n=1 Tax=uncultured Chloroflexia bacterium TaxID=1672391 RepID=A0A6J4H4F9_9CHLR|nr:MAG: hypothetical protein AVDCRST_MAG93-28 [uncultured Chloroflexia bacterium]